MIKEISGKNYCKNCVYKYGSTTGHLRGARGYFCDHPIVSNERPDFIYGGYLRQFVSCVSENNDGTCEYYEKKITIMDRLRNKIIELNWRVK